MTNTQLQVPAHIAARSAARKAAGGMSALAQALASTPQPPRISIKGSRFRLVENNVETNVGIELDVVIVGANPGTSKVFYKGDFDPNAEDQRPDCASSDGVHPDNDIADPQCDSCAACPNNELGSKINPTTQAKSKACGDFRYLAVVPAADPSKVYALTVTVTAMKGLRQFVQGLGNYGVEPNEVVTHLTFDDEASYPKLVFNRGEFLPAAALDVVDAVSETPEVAHATRVGVNTSLPAPDPAPAPTAAISNEDQDTSDAEEEETAAAAAEAAKKAAAAKKRKAATAAKKRAQELAAAAEAAAAEADAAEAGDTEETEEATATEDPELNQKLAGLFPDA